MSMVPPFLNRLQVNYTGKANDNDHLLNNFGGVAGSDRHTGGHRNSGGRYYHFGRVLGHGSFGVVCEAHCVDTGEVVAIKKVLQDPRYKNRELDVMKILKHPNIVGLRDYFYTAEENSKILASTNIPAKDLPAGGTSRFLNVVMDYVPETVYRVMRNFTRNDAHLPLPYVRLYAYQMCKSLGYLHSLGICHRDIKPQNLLVDSRTHILKLCDFGSAKRLTPGEPSVSYICSRFYRAPELMLGNTDYTTAIDIWSIGCVLGELLLGRPLFVGDTSVDQLVKIIQIRGTPTRREMHLMNPNSVDYGFPEVQRTPWRQVFASGINRGYHVPDNVFPLLDALLCYTPSKRATAYEALASPFFEPLRERPNYLLPDGKTAPNLFDFTNEELTNMGAELRRILIPKWAQDNESSIGNHSTIAPGTSEDRTRDDENDGVENFSDEEEDELGDDDDEDEDEDEDDGDGDET